LTLFLLSHISGGREGTNGGEKGRGIRKGKREKKGGEQQYSGMPVLLLPAVEEREGEGKPGKR